MNGHSVHRGGIHHDGQCTRLDGSLIWSEMLLAQHLWRDVCWCAVLARKWCTVAKEMLQRHSHTVLTHVVRIVALESTHGSTTHHGIHIAVLAIVLPDARPARVTTEVEGRGVGPRTTSGFCLVSCDASCFVRQLLVERCSHRKVLRKERTTKRVGHAVILVHTVNARNTDFLHRKLLNLSDDFLPFLQRGSHGARCVEDGTHLVNANDVVEFCLVNDEAPRLLIAPTKGVDVQFAHLSYFLLECHLAQSLFHLCFNLGIARNGWLHLCFSRQRSTQ